MVPSSLEPFALAATHEGAWYGADPTGYKFVRREVVRAQWAPALDSLLRKQTRGDIHGLKTRSHDQRGRSRSSSPAPSAHRERLRGLTNGSAPLWESAVPSMPHYRHPHEELFWRVQKRFLTKGASYKSGPSKGRRPLGSECCVTAGDSGDEAYTAIPWGVGLSRRAMDLRRTQ